MLCNYLSYFHLLTPTSQMIEEKFLYIPRTLFYYNAPPCPAKRFLSNHIIFLKCELKHTDVDITRSLFFFQNAKSSITKQKKYFLETSYGTSQTSELELFTKKVSRL